MHIFKFFNQTNVQQRIFCCIFIFSLITLRLYASYPLVRNLSRSYYNAGTQNWAIAQDQLGRMYFANNDGLLCFDGHNWSLLPLKNYTTIRSLHIAPENRRIYVGGSEEFGYFYHDPQKGNLAYCSLVETIKDREGNFHEIWNIHEHNRTLWFQADFKIFRYDGKQTETIKSPHKITASALIDGMLYVGTTENGVCYVHNKELCPVLQNEMLQNKRICAILPYRKEDDSAQTDLLIVTAFDGIYIFNGERVAPFSTDIDNFLKNNQIFCAACHGKEYIFGTVDNGAVIKNMADGSNVYINRHTGLQNNTVLSIFYDHQSNIWLGLDNGIDCIIQNSPIRSLLGSNLYGTGYTSFLHESRLFLGTNQGLYMTPYPIPQTVNPSRMSPLLKGQVWSIDTIGNTVFVSNDGGLFELEGNSFRRIPKIPGSWGVSPLRRHPDYALVSTYENFFLIKKENRHWQFVCKVRGYNESGGHLIEDQSGFLWVADWLKGVFRLKLSEDMTYFSENLIYNTNKGLPSDYGNMIFRIDGTIVVTTDNKGYYYYDAALDKMLPHRTFNENFGVGKSTQLYETPDHSIWCISDNHIRVARQNSNGSFRIDSTVYQSMTDKLFGGFKNFNVIGPNKLVFSGLDGFYEVNPQRKDTVQWNSKVFVSHVYSTGGVDSLIYTADTPAREFELVLPYTHNSLRFEFVMPEYRSDHAIQYSCFLENYDKEWNEQGTIHSKEYTQLLEGNYTFHVRAVNIYNGCSSEHTLSLTILPPWYRSIYAKLCYLVMLILLSIWMVYYIKAVSQRAAKALAVRKEKEMAELKRLAEEEALRKDYEISLLKSKQLEHDIKYKSQELSSITMNVIRKNEILIDIAEQINKLKEDKECNLNSSTTRKLGHIHQHIQENISHDDDWQNFSHNFDVVYDDFLKRLEETYPKLTNNDLRICAYLKMGLNSKDIAPLLNISYRSVEMNRYRLRAKLGLERNTNLTHFLQHF